MIETTAIANPENTLNKINVSIRFLESKCVSFVLTDYANTNKNAIGFDKYQFELNLNFKINEPEKSLNIFITLTLFEKQSENLKQQLATLQSSFVFNVVNFDELVTKIEEKKFEVNNGLLNMCFGISLSTTRGMYNVKLENTLYSNAILPIIDLDQLRNSNRTTNIV